MRIRHKLINMSALSRWVRPKNHSSFLSKVLSNRATTEFKEELKEAYTDLTIYIWSLDENQKAMEFFNKMIKELEK